MKNLKITIVAVGLTALALACKPSGKREIIISEDSNDSTLRIEYSGSAYFNKEGTAISSITPDGYIKYKKNDQQLVAESDKSGHITYQLNNGDKLSQLSGSGKIFLARAVKDMIKHGYNNDRKLKL